MRYFQDESAAFDRAAARDAYNATYDGDEARAQAVVDYHNTWPQMAPGTKLVLGKAGVPKDSEVAVKAAQLSEKRKARKHGNGLGDFIRAGSGKIGKVLGATGDVASTVTKGVVRTGFAAISAPFEEAQGLLRSTAGTIGGRGGGAVAGAAGGAALGAGVGLLGGPLAPVTSGVGAVVGGAIGGVLGFLGGDDIKGEGGLRSQSTFGQAIGNLVKEGEFDVGAGYFPGGKAHERAAAEARKTASIAGKGLTLGRLTANVPVISEPGSRQYDILSGLIDFGAAVRLDPTALAGAKLAKVNSARKTILSEKAGRSFLLTDSGAELISDLASRNSAYEIWNLSKKQLPVETAVALADEADPYKIRQLLDGELGVTVRQKFAPKVSRKLGRERLSTNLPTETLDWDNPTEFLEKIDGLQANARIPQDIRLKNNNEIMRALSGPRSGRLEPYSQVIKSILESSGLDGDTADVIRKMIPSSIEDARMYTASEIGRNTRVPGLIIKEGGQELPGPQLISEFLDAKIPVPNVQELRMIRQEVSKLAPIFQHPRLGPALRGSDILMTGLLNKVWKAGVLLRFAIVPRVAGEEQVRMATAGYDSVFSHPFSYMMRLTGHRGDVAVTGDRLRDSVEAAEAMSSRHSALGFMDQQGLVRTNHRAKFVPQEKKDFLRGWVDHELGHLRADPITQHFVNHGAQATSTWLREQGGQKFLKQLWAHRPDDPNFMRSRIDIDTYLEDVIGTRVKDFTQGDQRLLDYVMGRAPREVVGEVIEGPQGLTTGLRVRAADRANIGTIRGFEGDNALVHFVSPEGAEATVRLPISDLTPLKPGKAGSAVEETAIKAAREAVEDLHGRGIHPDKVVGDIVAQGWTGPGAQLDKVTGALFGVLMERPTNFLNRSKTFQQAYWKRAEELVGDLTQADQVKLLANAKKANLSKVQLDRIQKTVDDAAKVGTTRLDAVDTVSKAFGLEQTRDLLYDLSKKGMSSDALRLVMPFAEPWREMMTTWSKLLVEQPQFARRLQQTVEGARGAGFFTVDEQTGEEMFAYPGSSFLTKHLVGIPTPLKGRVAGLNLFAQNPLYPGFGPLVQIPAGALLDDKPEFDWARDAINPFGRSDESVTEQLLLPGAWVGKLKKVFADPESDRMFGNTVYDISRYLVSTGDYTVDSVDEQERTTKAAINMARKMYLLRAAASFSAPAAPSPEYQSALKDPTGRNLTQFQLIEEFRKLQEDPEVGFENAVDEFLSRYGEEALLYMQPKTKGGGPAVEDMQEWVRNNPELPSRYPEVYHFFGPRTGEFSYTAYERQLATGERQQITPAEALKLANNRVAAMQWRKAKDKVGTRPSPDQKAWLDDLKSRLLDGYPGWEPEPKDIGKFQRNARQLQEALEDPKLAKTETGQALEVYFLARDKANAQAKAAGFSSFGKAKAMRGTRDWLRGIADQLIDDTPDFEAVFEQVLSKEMLDDEPEVEFPLEEE